MDEEPWLRADCRDLYSVIMPGAVRVGKRGRMLRFSINQAWLVLSKDPNAQVLEFGVHTGRDLCLIDRMVRQKESERRKGGQQVQRRRVIIHGFDSFEGLPEDWLNGQDGEYDRGKFDLHGVPPDLKEMREYLGFPDEGIEENVVMHVGWFDNTVSSFFDEHPHPIAYCHADADLYSSTITFLEEMCRRHLLIKGSVITFDEYANYPGWEQGEYLAWAEIVQKYNIEFRYICYHAPTATALRCNTYNSHGYQSVSIVVTKVPW